MYSQAVMIRRLIFKYDDTDNHLVEYNDKKHSYDNPNVNDENKEHSSEVYTKNDNLINSQIDKFRYKDYAYVDYKDKKHPSETTTVGYNYNNKKRIFQRSQIKSINFKYNLKDHSIGSNLILIGQKRTILLVRLNSSKGFVKNMFLEKLINIVLTFRFQ